MVFSSFTFLLLYLPIFLAIYYIAPFRLRNGILFLGSLLFYAWGEPVYVSLMLFSSVVDYVHGILVEKYRGTKKSTAALVLSVCINLGLLGVFKYSGFVVQTLNQLLDTQIPVPRLALPIGISFYTFQTMSYTIDVYLKKAPVQRNFIDFGAYVSMFPQLIAGPIVRYVDVHRELNSRVVTDRSYYEGMRIFILGLGKKVLLANPCGELWQVYSNMESLSVFGSWIGILAFGLQIYFDFSGYSDMAIGLGKMLGFIFPANFNYPYVSKSITEFWRRWHMTLGTWFREYVYIPLGGNRKGLKRQLKNLLIVWALTGIWHGASWNFLLWGLYFAGFLVLEKTVLLKKLEQGPAWAAHVYALVVLAVGWVLFAFEDLSHVWEYLRCMIGLGSWEVNSGWIAAESAGTWIRSIDLYQLRNYAGLLILSIVGATPLPKRVLSGICKKEWKIWPWLELAGLFSLLVVCVAWLAADSYNPFLYFRF